MVDESQLAQTFYRHASSLVGPTASVEAHMAAQTAILLQIQADIAKLQHNGGGGGGGGAKPMMMMGGGMPNKGIMEY